MYSITRSYGHYHMWMLCALVMFLLALLPWEGAEGRGRSKPAKPTKLEAAVAPLPDATSPSVPKALRLNSTSDTEVVFSWTASMDNVGVTGYEVARDGVSIGSSSTTFFIDGTSLPGTTAHYAVKAMDAQGNASAWSTPLEVAVPPLPDTTLPSVPEALRLNSTSDTEVVFSWTASMDNVGVTGYEVARDGVSIGQASTTFFIDGTSLPGTIFHYAVKAMDAQGNASAWSTPLEVAVPPLPDTTPSTEPQAPQLNPTSGTDATFSQTAFMDNVGVTDYEVASDGVSIGQSPTTVFSDDTSLPGTTSRYDAKTMDTKGNASAKSIPVELAFASTPMEGDSSGTPLPQPGQRNYFGDVEFSMAAVRDAYISTYWNGLSGEQTQTVRLYSPDGQLFQTRIIPFTTQSGAPPTRRIVRGIDNPVDVQQARSVSGGGNVVVMPFPIAGTWVNHHEMMGTWRVEVYHNEATTPIVRGSFTLTE